MPSLVDRFNEQGFETPDGERMAVEAVKLDPESMVNAVLDGEATFQAMTPDSSVWLGQLDEEWSQQAGDRRRCVVGETVRYAVSPVVIAMWEDLAREMGWPDRAVSWQDLLARAQADPNFRWSHPSTSSASGLLATLAEFYAGAGKTRGLTIEDVTGPGNPRLRGGPGKDGPLLRRGQRAGHHRAGPGRGAGFPGRLCGPGADGRLL